MNELSEKEIKQLAAQLRSPDGSAGIEVGHKMHETNLNMTLATVEALKLTDGDIILEIGHGNAHHLEQILDITNDLSYSGLDISQTMHKEATRINTTFINSGQASFHLYNGDTFPFTDHHFHKMMTVNTIYFWENPLVILEEAHRILKNEGLFSISFAQKSFMEALPFPKYDFQLYDTNDVKTLAKKSPFQLANIQTQTEKVESKDGSQVERIFTIVSLQKE